VVGNIAVGYILARSSISSGYDSSISSKNWFLLCIYIDALLVIIAAVNDSPRLALSVESSRVRGQGCVSPVSWAKIVSHTGYILYQAISA
jgi:hypothetical protein